jgi:hypothetical protein
MATLLEAVWRAARPFKQSAVACELAVSVQQLAWPLRRASPRLRLGGLKLASLWRAPTKQRFADWPTDAIFGLN